MHGCNLGNFPAGSTGQRSSPQPKYQSYQNYSSNRVASMHPRYILYPVPKELTAYLHKWWRDLGNT